MDCLLYAASEAAVAAKHSSGSLHLASAQPSAPPSPETAATAVDAAGRAAAELAQFQDRQAGSGDDIDPDAPAAMKDSPSVSGDDAAGECPHASQQCPHEGGAAASGRAVRSQTQHLACCLSIAAQNI